MTVAAFEAIGNRRSPAVVSIRVRPGSRPRIQPVEGTGAPRMPPTTPTPAQWLMSGGRQPPASSVTASPDAAPSARRRSRGRLRAGAPRRVKSVAVIRWRRCGELRADRQAPTRASSLDDCRGAPDRPGQRGVVQSDRHELAAGRLSRCQRGGGPGRPSIGAPTVLVSFGSTAKLHVTTGSQV